MLPSTTRADEPDGEEDKLPHKTGKTFKIPESQGKHLLVNCGELKGILHLDKFHCPGIRSQCIQFEDGRLITPKEFTVRAGKDKQKDWKGSIRVGKAQLRHLMELTFIDFYDHANTCTDKCQSRNFVLKEKTEQSEKEREAKRAIILEKAYSPTFRSAWRRTKQGTMKTTISPTVTRASIFPAHIQQPPPLSPVYKLDYMLKELGQNILFPVNNLSPLLLKESWPKIWDFSKTINDVRKINSSSAFIGGSARNSTEEMQGATTWSNYQKPDDFKSATITVTCSNSQASQTTSLPSQSLPTIRPISILAENSLPHFLPNLSPTFQPLSPLTIQPSSFSPTDVKFEASFRLLLQAQTAMLQPTLNNQFHMYTPIFPKITSEIISKI